MDIGKAMMEIREQSGLSMSEMAKELCIRRQSVWKIEKGKSWPKPSTVEKFCEVVGIYRAELYLKSMGPEDLPPDKLDQSNILETLWFAGAMIRRSKSREK